ncbi:response regulator transcription factor [Massilia sp. BSC265]|uniref:response regulator n=1 Tax=Massilia sp. BSC265 TaxID=1549812 RepID=UPI0004E893F9|nr:response regulator transcription factor [Massilia sp. BSC265]KFI08935.1 swarming motility regulation protein RssB [Massilia sp. BSC265]
MRILLLEDDLALGRALQTVLHDDGWLATWVRLGADAERLLGQESFAALLLDLGLPDDDGLALLRRLRAAGHGLPSLVITARDSLEDRLSGFDGGADDYLIKPFDIPELLARLRAVVRRAGAAGTGSAAAPDPGWTLGDLALDPRRLSVSRAGQPLPVSRTEFALLYTLVRHADRIVTRAELEDGVLPYSGGQTLDVHMSNLRRKIGEGYIRTVRGVGYMVRDDA